MSLLFSQSSMSSLVLYRKYRPQRFDEVVGQEHVVRTISYAVAKDKPAHAYLFCGQRGVGKTTIARLLAKAVNCYKIKNVQEKDTQKSDVKGQWSPYEPCNECEACVAINNQQAMDIQEMDAASNRGIDEIRELIDAIKYPPSKLDYKVFIIDEVHMLTKPAFNALLKTLEEPPSHALFILATTEPDKVPDTITSRCQRFDFHKLTLPQIQKRLGIICKREGIKAEDKALRLIAVNSSGSVRDAESLLQQLISQGIENLTLEKAKDMLGVVDEEILRSFIEDIIAGAGEDALKKINHVLEQGKDLEQFTVQVLEYLRFIMLGSLNPELLKDEYLTEEVEKWAQKMGGRIATEDISQLMDIFSDARVSLNDYPLPQIAVEVAVVEAGEVTK